MKKKNKTEQKLKEEDANVKSEAVRCIKGGTLTFTQLKKFGPMFF